MNRNSASHYCDRRVPLGKQEPFYLTAFGAKDKLCLSELTAVNGQWVCPRHGAIYEVTQSP